MSRKPPAELAERIRLVRRERFGEAGETRLAALLDIPAPTWAGYESGATIPGVVLLRFLTLTRVRPEWLRTGDGPRYDHTERSRGIDA